MKLTKNLEAEILRVYNAYWDGYLRGDVESMISLLDSGYTQVGSAETEVFSSKKDAVKFLNDTIDQVAGKLEMRNRSTELEQRGNLILIHELCDVYVLADAEWIFYSRFRASTLMRRARGGWKILHQHSSFPDARTGGGENIATEKIAAENLELREAVKRRTIELEQKNRELETEAALERVRAVAMGMKEPADMLDVCRTISDQLQLLNVKNIRNVQTAILNDDKGTYLNYEYFAQYKTTSILEIVTKLHPKVEEFASEIRKARDAFFTTSFEGTALKEWIEYRKQTNQNADPILEKAASVHYYFYSVGPARWVSRRILRSARKKSMCSNASAMCLIWPIGGSWTYSRPKHRHGKQRSKRRSSAPAPGACSCSIRMSWMASHGSSTNNCCCLVSIPNSLLFGCLMKINRSTCFGLHG